MAVRETLPLLSRSRPGDEREARERPLDFGLILRLFHYTRPHAARRNGLLALVLLRSVQLPCLTWLIAAVINGPIASGDLADLGWGVLAFVALALFTQITMHFRQLWALELGESVVYDLRGDIFRHLQAMPMSFYNRAKVGRIISRMTSDVEDVRVGVQEVLFVTMVQLGQMAVAAGFMLWYNARLFLIVLALAPILWGINRVFHRRLSRSLRDVQESFSRITANLAESVNGIRVTQGFARQETNAKMFGALVADHGEYNHVVSRDQGMFLPLLDLSGQFFIAVLLGVGGALALASTGQAAVGDLVGFFFMASMFFAPITAIGTQYHQALTAMAGAERIFRLLDTPPEWSDDQTAREPPDIEGRVEFQAVSFGYDPERLVLHDLNFHVEPGQSVALVGHTGGGKTSLVNLLAKFHRPLEGKILVDGVDLAEFQAGAWRRRLGIVPQHNFLFSGTVLENARFARPEATFDEVIDAALRLDCLDAINELPQGFETPVGERGASLSLGQRQLVCFLRAMVANPRILILDEATSSVDALTEWKLQRALAALMEDRTSFVIAHRLSTIRDCDLVLVLDHGRIVEHGVHEELLPMGGHYAKLYERFASAAAA